MHADRYRFIHNFEVAVPVAQMHIKLPEKEPIITYLALRCGLSASWSVDVISLRLERLKRLLETVPFKFTLPAGFC